VAGRRNEDERAESVANDAPAVVVKLHVVEPTQQDAAIDVSATASCDVVDVM
tara:strand:- start:74 stop:229 length:156 start_codon:yes stop_codon:yes gene_type:complete